MLAQDDTLRCRRCHRIRTADELDRMMWCEDCRLADRRRGAWVGRIIAFCAGIALSFWIAIRVEPSRDFLVIWALVVIAVFYLLSRLGQELVYGVARVRNVPGARAGDPSEDPPGEREMPGPDTHQ
jgi:hypothetical protein